MTVILVPHNITTWSFMIWLLIKLKNEIVSLALVILPLTSRKKRIGAGSGTSIQQVNQLMKQFNQMSKMMKMMQGGGGKKMMQMMKNMPR